jgi:hypothetical protein
VGQSDVSGDLGDRVVHGGNHRLLGVSLDVMDTFLDGLDRSLFVLCYDILVHPLLVFPLVHYLVLECIVRVCQSFLLGSAVSEVRVHTSDYKESTQYLNKDPIGVPVLFSLGLWWWCCWHRVRVSKIVWKVFKVCFETLKTFQGRRDGVFRDFVLDQGTWENELLLQS